MKNITALKGCLKSACLVLTLCALLPMCSDGQGQPAPTIGAAAGQGGDTNDAAPREAGGAAGGAGIDPGPGGTGGNGAEAGAPAFPDAPVGTGDFVEQEVGVAGGDLQLGTVTLMIPPGVVAEGTTIRMTELEGALDPTLGHGATPVYRLEPAGLVFPEPITVRFAKPPGTDEHGLAVLWTKPGAETEYELVEHELIDEWVYVRSTHFSYFTGIFADLYYAFGGGNYGSCGDGETNEWSRWNPANDRYDVWQEDCDDGPNNTTQCAYGAGPCEVCTPDACESKAGFTASCGDGKLQAVSPSRWFEVPGRGANGVWSGLPSGAKSYELGGFVYEVCDKGPSMATLKVPAECPYGVRTKEACTFCTPDCQALVRRPPRWCGDNQVTDREVCDDGNEVTEDCAYGDPKCAHCNANCSARVPPRFCGNGTIEAPQEDCDGNFASACPYGQPACTVCGIDCKLVAGIPTRCGDGVPNGPEACDDGNTSTEGCAYGDESCLACDGDCLSRAARAFCGDKVVNGPEACDDGRNGVEVCPYGQASCSACSDACTVVPGVVTGWCGDGTVNGPEQCDDGNAVTEPCAYGDQSCGVCAAGCVTGPGVVVGWCGDGVVNGAEECDDFGDTSNDACAYGTSCTVCASACKLGPGSKTSCGDGLINGPEECDGTNHAGRTCVSLGFLGGTLSCSGACLEDTTACTSGTTSLAASDDYTCVVHTDGSLACWGKNIYHNAEPPGGVFKQVFAGPRHACALRVDGSVTCWGSSLESGFFPPGSFVSLALGDPSLTCGLRADGTITCWNKLGTVISTTPQQGTFTHIAASGSSLCALVPDGGMTCWDYATGSFPQAKGGPYADLSMQGSNTVMLDADGKLVGSFVTVSGLTFVQVAAGGATCGLTTAGDAACFESAVGDPVVHSGPFVRVVSGSAHVCALRADGSVACWPYQIPSDDANAQATVPVSGYSRIAACPVSTIAETCGIRGGALECFGSADLSFKTPPAGFYTDVSLRCGSGPHYGCALKADQSVVCWGDSNGLQITPPGGAFTRLAMGDGEAYGISADDQKLACWGYNCGAYARPTDPVADVSGNGLFCALRASDGAVLCWGQSYEPSKAQVAYPADTGYVQISSSVDHGCALKADGSLKCFGSNQGGKSTPPAGTFSAVAVARDASYAIRDDGTVAGWGASGSLALPIPPGTFTQLAVGSFHVCGLRPSGALTCWGPEYARVP